MEAKKTSKFSKKIGLRNYKLIENNIYLHTSYGRMAL